MSVLIRVVIFVVFVLSVPKLLTAQNYLINENFDNCTVPANWESLTLGSGWSFGPAAALESANYPIPSNGTCIAVVNDAAVVGNDASNDRLIMPKIDITGINSLIIQYDAVTPVGLSLFYIEYSHDSVNWFTGYSNNTVYASQDWVTNEFVANGGFFQGGNDLWLRFRYKDFGFESIGIAIDNFKVYEPGPNDMKVSALAKNEWSKLGTQEIKGKIKNNGSNIIQYCTVNWQLDNGSVGSQVIQNFTYGSFLNPSVISFFEIPNAYTLSTTGNHELKVWTSMPNGATDQNFSNDTIITIVKGANDLPEKRVLLEKFMHTLCGPCYNANFYFDQILDSHPFVTGASIHSAPSDPFSIPDGDLLDNIYTFAHPEFIADRRILYTNTDFGINQYQSSTEDLDLAVLDTQAVSVAISNVIMTTLPNTIQFDVTATFYGDYDSEMGINAYILEDSVLGYMAGAPNPNNYYHKNMVRDMLGGTWGAPFQMSDVVGGQYTKTFEYVIPSDQNPDNFKILGFVQKISNNMEQRDILNCTPAIHLSEAISLSVLSSKNEQSLVVYPNPINTVFRLAWQNTLKYDITIYDFTGKEVYQQIGYSDNSEIDLSYFESGIYVVSAKTSTKSIHHTLIVKE